MVESGAAGIVEYLATIFDATLTKALTLNEIDLIAIDLAICQLPSLTYLNLANNKIDIITPEVPQTKTGPRIPRPETRDPKPETQE